MDTVDIRNGIIPCDTESPYVFISYSSCDQELVYSDVRTLQQRGYNIWTRANPIGGMMRSEPSKTALVSCSYTMSAATLSSVPRAMMSCVLHFRILPRLVDWEILSRFW